MTKGPVSLESCLWLGQMGINDKEVTTWLCPSMEYNSVTPSHCISVTNSSEVAMRRTALGESF